jgi:hypothetical protein
MIERRDDELSRIYRDAEGPRPPQRVDDNILAASQRVAGARRRPFGFARRWGTPVALAATVLVTFTLALMVFERQSGLEATAPEARRKFCRRNRAPTSRARHHPWCCGRSRRPRPSRRPSSAIQ